MDLKEEEEREKVNMEQKVKKFLELSEQESETVSGVAVPELRLDEAPIYNLFALRGIRVNRVGPGFVSCNFKVPLRLLVSVKYKFLRTNYLDRSSLFFVYENFFFLNFWWVLFYFQDRDGNLANGAIANLVDIVGSCVVYVTGLPMNVTVEMSISYLSTAKLNVSNPATEIPIRSLLHLCDS